MDNKYHVAIAVDDDVYWQMCSDLKGSSRDLFYACEEHTFYRQSGACWTRFQWSRKDWPEGSDGVNGLMTFLSKVPHEFLLLGECGEVVLHINTTDFPNMLK